MSFWQVTMRRSVRLSRTYFILGVAISVYGTILSNILPATKPVNATEPVNVKYNLQIVKFILHNV